MTIFLEQDEPQFQLTDPVIMTTDEGEVCFEAGDPLQVQVEGDNIILGGYDTVLVIEGNYAKSDLLKIIIPAQFEIEEEDESGVFFKNILSNEEKPTIESLIARMTTLQPLTESDVERKYIRVKKITIATSGDKI